MTRKKPLKIAIVAGEMSGDVLGAGLIQAIEAQYPNTRFEGIGGQAMQAVGFKSLYPMEPLSVMGLVEVLGAYFTLKRCHSALIKHFIKNPPDVFIGIDAPDFNLSLERALKKKGIPTVHYVSPSIWAWRAGRLKKIVASADLMLTLLPFEEDCYKDAKIKTRFVGHPLAEKIPLYTNKDASKRRLGIKTEHRYIALLPGSRHNEVKRLAPVFLETAQWLLEQQPDLRFIVPLANKDIRKQFTEILEAQDTRLPIYLRDGDPHAVIAASEVVLVASGTATLETMLLKRPMVVAYRLAGLTYKIAKFLVKTPYFALPNLLLRKPSIPEFIQHQATPEAMGEAILSYLDDTEKVKALEKQFNRIHLQLRQDGNRQAADAILGLIGH